MSLPSADDFCTCGDVPWQHADGPLKDGSHFTDCRRAEAQELWDEIERVRAAHRNALHKVLDALEANASEFERGFKRARAKL